MLRNGEYAKKFTIQDNPAMQRFASFPAGRAWRSLSVAAINPYQRNSVLRARVLLVASEAIPLAKPAVLPMSLLRSLLHCARGMSMQRS
jgi:hypothetical protein